MFEPAIRYFRRAAWALNNSTNDELSPEVRSHLLATAVHACQSLRESLIQVSEDSGGDSSLDESIKALPHVKLIENVRNMDIHGWPIPICDPRIRSVEIISKPGQPITLSSAKGVGVAMRLDGLKPIVHRYPKDLKHGTVAIGGATVSFGCDQGKLYVHDFSTAKDYLLQEVLSTFLGHCDTVIKDQMSTVPNEDASPQRESDDE